MSVVPIVDVLARVHYNEFTRAERAAELARELPGRGYRVVEDWGGDPALSESDARRLLFELRGVSDPMTAAGARDNARPGPARDGFMSALVDVRDRFITGRA